MVVDNSALLAIVFREPEEAAFSLRMSQGADLLMSVANWLESAIRVDWSPNPLARTRFDGVFTAFEITLIPVSPDQARLAREAYRRYDRGNHPAGLNFGDCFAYALAKSEGRALLFKENDFSRTDIAVA